MLWEISACYEDVSLANHGHNSTTSLESAAGLLIKLNDDLTGELTGFEVMSDHLSTMLTEIGLMREERLQCLDFIYAFTAKYRHNTTRLLESTTDLFTKLNDDLTGKFTGFEAMRDHLISAATKINLAYGPNNSECMLAVQHFHPVS